MGSCLQADTLVSLSLLNPQPLEKCVARGKGSHGYFVSEWMKLLCVWLCGWASHSLIFGIHKELEVASLPAFPLYQSGTVSQPSVQVVRNCPSLVLCIDIEINILWYLFSEFWKIFWRREWQPTPVFLPEKFHGQRSLAGYSPWGYKELDMTERLTLF